MVFDGITVSSTTCIKKLIFMKYHRCLPQVVFFDNAKSFMSINRIKDFNKRA